MTDALVDALRKIEQGEGGGEMSERESIDLVELVRYPLRTLVNDGWRSFCFALWQMRPIRCVTCRRWFHRGDFWNPWGPNSGPGLACSQECCEAAVPGSTPR